MYHNLNLNEKSSYLTTLACQFGRYRYKRLLFGGAPTADMSQRKIDEIFKDLPNVFGITDDVWVVHSNRVGKDHDDALHGNLQVCTQVNLKLNKDKCHFRCTKVLFFGKIISRNGAKPDPLKLKAMTEMPPPKIKTELQAFLGIINYLS